MAKVTAPLLSLGATGKIAGSLVFSTWKGIKTARQLVKPANPNTTAQQSQRSLFTAMVSFWRNYLTDATQRTGWDVAAGLSGKPQSGFNLYAAANLALAATDPDASFGVSYSDDGGGEMSITMKNIDDGTTGDEAGDFDVYLGSEPDDLSLHASNAIAAGLLGTSTPGVGSGYCQVLKDGQPRTGIFAYTLA